jgi:cytochrome b pre-mRNA-processing protein 3
MILKRLFQKPETDARRLYGAIVAAARQERFYADWGVPDTLDGRFDMICLHMYLALSTLRGKEQLRQKLTDDFFADMDRSLREMGVGDLSVGKKVRKMAEAFYGRITAYEAAKDDPVELEKAIERNVLAKEPGKLAAYVIETRLKGFP